MAFDCALFKKNLGNVQVLICLESSITSKQVLSIIKLNLILSHALFGFDTADNTDTLLNFCYCLYGVNMAFLSFVNLECIAAHFSCLDSHTVDIVLHF